MEGHHSLKADNRDKPGIKNLHGLTRKLLGFFLPGMTDKKKSNKIKQKCTVFLEGVLNYLPKNHLFLLQDAGF